MPKKVPPNSAFGQKLMELRLERGLTQSQLAELIDSSQRCISRYETIAELPPANVLIRLAQILDVTTDEILGLKSPKLSIKNKDDPETKRLWKKFQQVRELPEKDQRAVIRLINSLVAAQHARSSNGSAARR